MTSCSINSFHISFLDLGQSLLFKTFLFKIMHEITFFSDFIEYSHSTLTLMLCFSQTLYLSLSLFYLSFYHSLSISLFLPPTISLFFSLTFSLSHFLSLFLSLLLSDFWPSSLTWRRKDLWNLKWTGFIRTKIETKCCLQMHQDTYYLTQLRKIKIKREIESLTGEVER